VKGNHIENLAEARVYHHDSVRRLSHRIAAVTVACVFATLPSLSRIHDRLTAHDDVTRFRLSQNLERPHQKAEGAPLVAMPVFRIAADTSPHSPVEETHASPLVAGFLSATDSRAPPVR
jgi:hypothetical protein